MKHLMFMAAACFVITIISTQTSQSTTYAGKWHCVSGCDLIGPADSHTISPNGKVVTIKCAEFTTPCFWIDHNGLTINDMVAPPNPSGPFYDAVIEQDEE
ncbi:MAG: hypothetical protein K1X91_16105 [Bacteriodetes bacterium]|nr:hypothetical protein [Bacteroidota bacterium]